jgi:hypothetical protein
MSPFSAICGRARGWRATMVYDAAGPKAQAVPVAKSMEREKS